MGEGTQAYGIRKAMYYPQPAADEILQQMLRRGLVRREVSTTRGVLLHRVK